MTIDMGTLEYNIKKILGLSLTSVMMIMKNSSVSSLGSMGKRILIQNNITKYPFGDGLWSMMSIVINS